MLYPNGTIYIKGKPDDRESDRFDEIIRRLTDLERAGVGAPPLVR